MPEMRPPRPGEQSIDLPEEFDASLYFIGRIHTPWKTTGECPKNSAARRDVPATVELDARYRQGLGGIEQMSHLILMYWLDRSARNLIIQAPSHAPQPRGVFALRSPVRPNPIGLSVVELVSVAAPTLTIRNIDCVDGTPLIDIKPYFASTDSVPDARRP
jgi:tRNA-Thr(GGU) m(6)t(6)A37 methyltransferase TsaA